MMPKRTAEVPRSVRELGERLSKADLLEVAYHFALLLSGEEDATTALDLIVGEARLMREAQQRPVPRFLKKSHTEAVDVD